MTIRFLVLLFLFPVQPATSQDENPTEFRELIPLAEAMRKGQIAAATRVDFEATLVCWDRDWDVVYVQNGPVGLGVNMNWFKAPKEPPRLGSKLRITGIVWPSRNTIEDGAATVVQDGSLPAFRTVDMSKPPFLQHVGRYIQTEGMVEQVVLFDDARSTLMTLRQGRTRFLVRYPFPLDETMIDRAVGSRWLFRGVLDPVMDPSGQPRFYICHVVDPRTQFTKTTLKGSAEREYQRLLDGQISRLTSDSNWSEEWVEFRAQTGERLLNNLVILGDESGSGAIPMATMAGEFIPGGSAVNIQGKVDQFGDLARINAHIIRVGKPKELPPPVPMKAKEIIDRNAAWHRVAVVGQIERVLDQPDGLREIYLRQQGVPFRAVLRASDSEFDKFELDGGLSIKTVGVVSFEKRKPGTRFTLHTSAESLQVDSPVPPATSKADSNHTALILLVISISLIGVIGAFVLAGRSQNSSRRIDSSSQLIAAFDSVQEGMLTFDRSGRLTHINSGVEKVLGVELRSSETVADVFDALLGAVGDDIVFQTAWQQCHEERDSRSNVDIQSNTNAGRQIAIYSAPILDKKNEVSGRIWRFEDTTEKRELEDRLVQSQKIEAVGRLAGGIAHDFNNLLMGITTNLELAKQNADEQSLSCIDEAVAASTRAADLVSHLLKFSRKSPLNRRRSSVNIVVERVTKLLRRTFDSTIELVTTVDSDLGHCAMDLVLVEQVLINLCINSRDALGDAGGAIRVTTRNSDSGDWVQLTVEDNGHGMDDATRARIFEPFFTTKEVGKGTGLGLAMSYGIVEQHGGRIECSSTKGKGTRIDVFLPRCDIGDDEQVDDDLEERSRPLRGDGRLLLADDDETVRASLETMLSSRGYEVTAVSNGHEAVAALEQGRKYEIVLLDRTMPVLSGHEAFKIISDRHPEIPVVILSGHACDIRELKNSNGRTPNAVLIKPCEIDRLVAILQRLKQEYVR